MHLVHYSIFIHLVLQILGLEICADTMVGDEMLRGISGGQRKRVTTGKDIHNFSMDNLPFCLPWSLLACVAYRL
jgi:hypothetical protein